MKPYIGITDFTEASQVHDMLDVHTRRPKESDRMLHVGVMMSRKTLRHIPSKWTGIFPDNKSIADIFFTEAAYNCLHYADYEDFGDLWRNLYDAIMFGGMHIHALQLDMIWPDPCDIAHAVHMSRKRIEVILQVGRDAMNEADDDPVKVTERLADYDGVIDRVLLDRSMGRGLGMDATALIPYAEAIRDAFPALGIGAAGGLGPDTLDLVKPFIKAIPDLSIDAQGRLRPSGDARNPIDWDMASTYLERAHRLVAGTK